MARALSDADILRLLLTEIDKAGGQSEWARRTGVSRTHLNKAIKGHKAFGPKILKALKIKTVYVRDNAIG